MPTQRPDPNSLDREQGEACTQSLVLKKEPLRVPCGACQACLGPQGLRECGALLRAGITDREEKRPREGRWTDYDVEVTGSCRVNADAKGLSEILIPHPLPVRPSASRGPTFTGVAGSDLIAP